MKEVKNGKIIIKFSIMWFFIAIIIIALIISFFKNRIFATNTANKEEQTIVAFEENQKSIDVIEVMLENTNSDKKMVNEQRDVQFETQYEDNPNLPRDEEQVKQEGKIGKIQVTALQEYKDDQMINEEIIDSKTLEEVVTKIIYKGTSDFLKKYSVHIDDQMYLLEAEDLKEEAKDDSNTICNVPRYLNVKIKEAGEEWIKVAYNGKEGYLKTTNITSEAVTPMIKEKNRIATLKNNLNVDMDLSVPSGLTLSDFKTVLSNNLSDKNKIFEQSAEYFYKAEQKYKVNGIFLASIGIHESAWGTSKIANDKNNLFGFTAYDSDPYNSATSFDNYENAINKVAEVLSTKYLHVAGTKISDELTATGTYFNGTSAKSVNVRYASDTGWADKVFNYMQYLYNKL
ncbi:MAG: G5 domain-containing protein [Clostridia bacterium]|jgi:beta-N-acetylglucosaminidase